MGRGTRHVHRITTEVSLCALETSGAPEREPPFRPPVVCRGRETQQRRSRFNATGVRERSLFPLRFITLVISQRLQSQQTSNTRCCRASEQTLLPFLSRLHEELQSIIPKMKAGFLSGLQVRNPDRDSFDLLSNYLLAGRCYGSGACFIRKMPSGVCEVLR